MPTLAVSDGTAELDLTYQWLAQVLLRLKVHDENIAWLHQLFLNTRRSDEDVISISDRDTASCARHPAKGVELLAQRADVVCWVLWVAGGHQRIV